MKYLTAASIALILVSHHLVHAQSAQRAVSAARFGLMIDGQQAGLLNSFSGGTPFATVAQFSTPESPFPNKHLASLQYEAIRLQLGIVLPQLLQQWLASTLRGEVARHSGSIVGFDNQLTAVQQRNFAHALITEVTFPALDAASREPGLVTIELTPEFTELVKSSGAAASFTQSRQKAFIASNFRFELDGLDTKRVSKIDAFTIKQKITEDQVGELRDPSKEPTSLEFPNLTVTLSAAALESWQSWFDEFVIQGQSGDNREKSGRIVLLGPNQEELLAIALSNVGIFALRQLNPEGNSNAIPQLEAKLYVERMELLTK